MHVHLLLPHHLLLHLLRPHLRRAVVLLRLLLCHRVVLPRSFVLLLLLLLLHLLHLLHLHLHLRWCIAWVVGGR